MSDFLKPAFRAILLTLVASIFWKSHAEMFSSIAEMENLVRMEKELLQKLQLYRQSLSDPESSIPLNKYLNKLRSLTKDADEHGLFHPNAAFLHLLLLTRDLKDLTSTLKNTINTDLKYDELNAFIVSRNFPGEFELDLQGAAIAFERLQETYLIDAAQFADGIFFTVQNNKKTRQCMKLEAEDCFVVASQLFDAKHFLASYEWLLLVLDRCNADKNEAEKTCSDDIVASAFAQSSYIHFLGENITGAVSQVNQALKFDPNCSEALQFRDIYLNQPSDREITGKQNDMELDVTEENLQSEGQLYDREHLGSLCRGDAYEDNAEDRRDIDSDMSMLCRIVRTRGPYEKELQIEELDSHPEIKVFRNFATTEETDYLISQGLSSLKRARVDQDQLKSNQSAEDYDIGMVTHVRTAKTAWLNHNHSNITSTISQRIAVATGLDLEYGEKMQLANYGLGGHYQPHFDFRTSNLKKNSVSGNFINDRMVTFMLYLTDVEAGGATVFLKRNLTVWPKKGDALFWYNLNRDGSGHEETLHAGCPVLLGSKWVMNVWIHSAGQELKKPCLASVFNTQ